MQHLVCDYAEMFSFDMFQDNTGLTGQDALQRPVCASIQALFIDFSHHLLVVSLTDVLSSKACYQLTIDCI